MSWSGWVAEQLHLMLLVANQTRPPSKTGPICWFLHRPWPWAAVQTTTPVCESEPMTFRWNVHSAVLASHPQHEAILPFAGDLVLFHSSIVGENLKTEVQAQRGKHEYSTRQGPFVKPGSQRFPTQLLCSWILPPSLRPCPVAPSLALGLPRVPPLLRRFGFHVAFQFPFRVAEAGPPVEKAPQR